MTAVFGNKKEDNSPIDKEKKPVEKTGKGKVVKKDSKKKKKVSEELINKADLVNKTIINPVVSEDAMKKTADRKYVFNVHPDSNKNQVAEAMEVLYGVEVIKVNIMKYKQRSHRFRMTKGQKSGYKKAIVTIKKGQEIDLFSE